MTEAAIQSESANNADGPREPHLRQCQSYSTDAACGSRTSLRSVRLPHASIIRDNFDGRPQFRKKGHGVTVMLIENIQKLQQGTVIPKPEATADFKIKGWGERRGESALIYLIPNHKNPSKPLAKGVTISEFKRAHEQIMATGQLTRAWFNSNLASCAKEGGCNFTTIGGIFELLGLASYSSRGTYVLC